VKKINIKTKELFFLAKKIIVENIIFILVSLIYIFLMISTITWGIPNINHPFNYHMDEWHQLQSVKEVFNLGSPNVPGAAHGPILQFFLTGVYLVPFYILNIIDPFAIKSGIDAIPMQTMLFIILRFNTIIFGVFSLFILNRIAKQFLKVNPILPLLLFTFTPIWLGLGNYFKYDIALVFWILFFVFLILRYAEKNSLKNFILAGIVGGLTLSTKLSAIPIFPIYLLSFFIFTSRSQKRFKTLLLGLVLFTLTFGLFGIPDVILGKAQYGEFLSSNLLNNSEATSNFIYEFPHWSLYLLLKILPSNFGHAFFIIFSLAFIGMTLRIVNAFINKKTTTIKIELFFYISLILFSFSLGFLKIWANGNRLLVLLPFLVLISSIFIIHIANHTFLFKKKIILLVIIFIFFIQFFESLLFVSMKWGVDVRYSSSKWLVQNIPKGSTIGVENIPIYQLLPDIIVKEFYTIQYNPITTTIFKYKIIDAKTDNLPSIIVIANKELEGKYFKKSAKKDLLQRINRENYVIKKVFKPYGGLYLIFNTELDMFLSGLVPIPTLTVYSLDQL